MTKSKFNSVVGFLRECFSGDQDANALIDELVSHGDKIEWKESAQGDPNFLQQKDFPLPAEMSGKQTAFALFSDGACRGNPGPGAWGALGQDSNGEVLFRLNGAEELTTNNKMELEGAIQALSYLQESLQKTSTSEPVNIFLYSDSKYVVDGINLWVPNWKSKGWKRAQNKVPDNLEYWKRLDLLVHSFPNLKILWVKGHAGHPQNEYCDQLANHALDQSGY